MSSFHVCYFMEILFFFAREKFWHLNSKLIDLQRQKKSKSPTKTWSWFWSFYEVISEAFINPLLEAGMELLQSVSVSDRFLFDSVSAVNSRNGNGCNGVSVRPVGQPGPYRPSEVSGHGTAFTWPWGPDPHLCWPHSPPSSRQGPKPFEPSPQPPAECAPSAH